MRVSLERNFHLCVRESCDERLRVRKLCVPVLGNILDEKGRVAKLSGHRSASPTDEKGPVICHTPTNGLEDETSSDDTEGQVCRENGGRIK